MSPPLVCHSLITVLTRIGRPSQSHPPCTTKPTEVAAHVHKPRHAHYFPRVFFSRVGSSLGIPVGSCQGDLTRPVRLENLLIRPDSTRPVRFRTPPDPTRLDPLLFENLLTRPVVRAITPEKPCILLTRVTDSPQLPGSWRRDVPP